MDFYGTFGYADVDVQAVRRANFADNTVQVDFEITEGRKYRVEEINITGNKITKEKVILRELAIMEGDPLDTNRVEVSRQRLLGMGYFNRVDATMQAGERADSRRVVFDVEEKDPYTFRIGGGFSDSDSLAGMVEFSNNNFDITNPVAAASVSGCRRLWDWSVTTSMLTSRSRGCLTYRCVLTFPDTATMWNTTTGMNSVSG